MAARDHSNVHDGIEGGGPDDGMLPRKSTIQVPEPLRLEMGGYILRSPGRVNFATMVNCRVISLVRGLLHSSQGPAMAKIPRTQADTSGLGAIIFNLGEMAGTNRT